MSLTPLPLLQNPAQLPWIVQKFGGTGVGKFIDAIARQIVKEYIKHNRIAVVCSARSGDTKLTGTTSRLIRAFEAAVLPGIDDYLLITDEILADHLATVDEVIFDTEIKRTLRLEIIHECSQLKSFLEAVQVLNELSPRSKGMIIGMGEKLACKIVAAALQDRGVDSIFVSLEDIVDDIQYSGNSQVLDQSFYDRLAVRIADKVHNSADHRVPVVTGFFGPMPGSLLTAVGRGYTDLCAALVAVGLGAEQIQIWKEADGVFAADPQKVKNARLLPVISSAEVSELTSYGSEVVHPLTMEQVFRANIPIHIKNVEKPFQQGTIITTPVVTTSSISSSSSSSGTTPPLSPDLCGHGGQDGFRMNLTVKGHPSVTIKENIVVINVRSNRKKVSHTFFAGIFSILDRHGIVIDLLATSEVQVSMALCRETNNEEDFEKVFGELRALGRVDIIRNMATLSLVGKKMGHTACIAGILFTTLASVGSRIEMISQGASEINISCVIDEASATAALNAIHNQILCKTHELTMSIHNDESTTSESSLCPN